MSDQSTRSHSSPEVVSGTSAESGLAWQIVQAALTHNCAIVAVAANEQQAYRLEGALRFFASGRVPVLHLPDNETLPYDPFSPHQELLSDRMAALNALPEMVSGIVLLTADALMQRLPPRSFLDARSLVLKTGQQFDLHGFRQRLMSAGYAATGEVQTQGEFAVRGALIDVFPMGSDLSYRLDLFDDEIESIRTFDPETQRSTDKVESVRLLPAREFPTDKGGIENFRRNYREYFPGDPSRSRIYAEVTRGFMPAGIEAWLPLFFGTTAKLVDYLPRTAKIARLGDLESAFNEDWKQISDRFERLRGDIERPLMRPEDLFLSPEAALQALKSIDTLSIAAPDGALDVPGSADGIRAYLADNEQRILFVAESAGRKQAVIDWLKPQGILPRSFDDWASFADASSARKNKYGIALGPLQHGLKLPDDNISLIAEPGIFGQRAPVESRKRNKVRDPETILRDLSSLAIGAPVVHVQHGVGRYRGLTRMEAGGIETEFLVLEYAARTREGRKKEGLDKLYVPVASLQMIHRYTGAEDETAPLHSLGSERWGKAQAKARDKANDVAAELLQIQARRAAREGNALSVDEADYLKFCEGFPFTPTEDQQKAIDAVLADVTAAKSMDRVVCGDVGFGKTEVALRACFAVARAGKQVCLLAPTTLLAQQHEKNFSDRFADWPIRVGALSRLRTSKEQTEMLKQLAAGSLDIVIGTHRLLQADVKFKDLGLVVVDEEHRFGVRHKEKLKNLRAEVDLLTLTATPIPRTLNMSLAGLRDLSIIATPPASRIAIKTFVSEWDRGLVIEACQRELRRGGQVYILHNEVSDIEKFSRDIQEMLPEGRVRFAHGQMRERELEQVMLDFYHQRFDILVCTTIIESGIDVPSANTILIDRADRLGLAQLHQLRGRVGRSHHRAFAYLFVPSRRALSTDAQKRLEAIESLGDLGSGFALATHDLEIRGAGELLGDDQSGQIEEVGFTLYAELLARAVKAIKAGTLDDAPFGEAACEVDLGASALISDSFIPDVHTRLVLYKRASEATSTEDLFELRVEVIDRFGELPEQVDNLFQAASVRITAQELGLTRVRAGSKSAVLEFGPKPNLNPRNLIKLIQSQPKVYKLEGQKKLHINASLDPVDTRASRLLQLLATLREPAPSPAESRSK